MTNEQWLVYLWSIYPQGGISIFWFCGFCVALTYIFIIWIGYSECEMRDRNNTQFVKTGKWKFIVPVFVIIVDVGLLRYIPTVSVELLNN